MMLFLIPGIDLDRNNENVPGMPIEFNLLYFHKTLSGHFAVASIPSPESKEEV